MGGPTIGQRDSYKRGGHGPATRHILRWCDQGIWKIAGAQPLVETLKQQATYAPHTWQALYPWVNKSCRGRTGSSPRDLRSVALAGSHGHKRHCSTKLNRKNGERRWNEQGGRRLQQGPASASPPPPCWPTTTMAGGGWWSSSGVGSGPSGPLRERCGRVP